MGVVGLEGVEAGPPTLYIWGGVYRLGGVGVLRVTAPMMKTYGVDGEGIHCEIICRGQFKDQALVHLKEGLVASSSSQTWIRLKERPAAVGGLDGLSSFGSLPTKDLIESHFFVTSVC